MRFSKGLYPHLTKERWGRIRFHKELDSRITDEIQGVLYQVINKVELSYVSKVFVKEAAKNITKIGAQAANVLNGELFSYIGGRCHYFGIIGKATFMVSNGILGAYVICEDFLTHGTDGAVQVVYEKALLYEHPHFVLNQGTDKKFAMESLLVLPINIYSFKHFAELKAKQLPPKGKLKDFHCRYKSDLNIPINLLTENWYTESCQNHPFVVRGHWRMQACGEGLSERKLIYVNPFMKKGYTKGTYKDN